MTSIASSSVSALCMRSETRVYSRPRGLTSPIRRWAGTASAATRTFSSKRPAILAFSMVARALSASAAPTSRTAASSKPEQFVGRVFHDPPKVDQRPEPIVVLPKLHALAVEARVLPKRTRELIRRVDLELGVAAELLEDCVLARRD